MSSTGLAKIPGGQVKAKLGRPQVCTAEERCRRILAAAERIFMTEGYGAATMEGISRAAGMSKRTVYGFFPDKEHMLVALFSDTIAFPLNHDKMCEAAACPREAFRTDLLAMMQYILLPRQILLARLLISEAGRSPSLAEDFHERIMRTSQAYLATGLVRLKASEPGLIIGDPEYLSMTIFSAAMGDLHFRALLGKTVVVSNELLLDRINSALRLILPGLNDNDVHSVNDRARHTD
ncbi:TetR/AcrR family transcriptional regulator [Sodalis sp. RH22]|uniref:TetR/AcrR family transcriptional regulator n=1 Tax=unclassified Sodalis (in: enterobacteria) TaxID=2636512 RepID=UPI0039B61605